MADAKPASNPRSIKFQELTICSLKYIRDWIEVNVPSLSYALIVDLHNILEHVYHQINLSKSTLDVFQNEFKLEIPTPNHVVSIQLFCNPLPKFYCKSKDYKVVRGSESLFNSIQNYDDWDEPSYGFSSI